MGTPAVRRRTMQAVKSKDTAPEMAVRRTAFAMGYRYRLHGENLPGKPDLVFASRLKVIFVHGCFWHGHDCRRGARTPKENRDYWQAKIARNQARDGEVRAALTAAGWDVLTIWECEIREPDIVQNILSRFLNKKPAALSR